MKKTFVLFITCLFMVSGLLAQENYTGGAQPSGDASYQQVQYKVINNGSPADAYLGNIQPEGYKQQILGNGSREWTGCAYCSIPEGEADIPDGGTDITNGGCNVTPNLYMPIQFGDVYCGRGNGYLGPGGAPSRDTDWYEFTLTETKTVYWSGIANFNCVFYIVVGPCSSPNVLASATPAPGTVGVATYTLGPGTYWAFVAPTSYGTDPLLDGDYMATLTDYDPGTPDHWCYLCLDCAIPEGEPPIVDNIGDLTNYGCNGVEFEPDRPPLFSAIQFNQVICGTAEQYVYFGNAFRDTDWYRMIIHSTTTVYYSGIANFDLRMFIIKGPCEEQTTISSLTLAPGVQGTIMAVLSPGEYYFWAGPSNWTITNEGNYQVLVTTEPPGNYTTWCQHMVPVSNWALYLGIGLILAFALFRIKRLI